MSENEKKRREQKRAILSFCLKLTTVCLMLWAVFTFLIGVTQMKGESMYPRIRDGDVVLSYRLERKYAIGDVVTFQVNDIQRIARVTAMEGDIVEITPEGQLMVNGSIQEEEIFYPTEEISRRDQLSIYRRGGQLFSSVRLPHRQQRQPQFRCGL